MEVVIKNDHTKEIEKKVHDRLGVALEAVGQMVEGYASAKAPYDTGNLSGSITHRVSNDEVVVGTNVSYGKYQELGTSRIKPHPYLKPAVVDNKSRIRDIFTHYLQV